MERIKVGVCVMEKKVKCGFEVLFLVCLSLHTQNDDKSKPVMCNERITERAMEFPFCCCLFVSVGVIGSDEANSGEIRSVWRIRGYTFR